MSQGKIFVNNIHGKNAFAERCIEVSKNLVRYRLKNNVNKLKIIM